MHPVKQSIQTIKAGNKSERRDAFKAIVEFAEKQPQSVLPEIDFFIDLLSAKENRVQWESMQVITILAPHCKDLLFQKLDLLALVAENGSVITRDHYVKILAILSSENAYKATTIPLLIDEVLKSPINQLCIYAEATLSVKDKENKPYLKNAVMQRIEDTADLPAKRKRLEKVLKKL